MIQLGSDWYCNERLCGNIKEIVKLMRLESIRCFSSTILFNGVFKVESVCSAATSEDGWWGEIVKCLIPFNLPKLLNSWLENKDPLSLTRKCYVTNCKYFSKTNNYSSWFYKQWKTSFLKQISKISLNSYTS